MHLTGRFEVPDNDPAGLTESEWQSMRQEAGELEYAWQKTYQALIEAAHAEPALRALYSFTSHWALRFSTTTRPRLTVVGPCLLANSDGTYAVGRSLASDDLGRFATAHEAVAIAVRHLPPGPGPVALGERPFRIPGGVACDDDTRTSPTGPPPCIVRSAVDGALPSVPAYALSQVAQVGMALSIMAIAFTDSLSV
ncbi:DUF6193 family natural product biosynthesis protein [Streptomyces sp. Ru72]|uniref:DUF6193 family natural product biosynthesis protein n=1 Tax=Streptomyces sp. Ru72 TaxID=2080747 RepID=UPI0021566A0D|nr:DUF6193 family natural product biosynthesis protein [Streptomyces sp. Ru72]